MFKRLKSLTRAMSLPALPIPVPIPVPMKRVLTGHGAAVGIDGCGWIGLSKCFLRARDVVRVLSVGRWRRRRLPEISIPGLPERKLGEIDTP